MRNPQRRGAAALLGGAAVLLLAGAPTRAQAQTDSNTLPTGRRITPTGTQQNVGSLPVNIALTPDGKYALVSDMGFRQYLTCLDTRTGRLAQPVTATPPAPTNGSVPGPPVSASLISFGAAFSKKPEGLYYGLAVTRAAADGSYTAYAAQGAAASIAVLRVGADGSLSRTGTIHMRPSDFCAGLALDPTGRLYVAVNDWHSGAATLANDLAALTTPGSLVTYDTTAPGVVTPGGAAPVPASPAPEAARVLFNGPADTYGAINTPTAAHPTLPGPAVPFTPTNYPFAVAVLEDGSAVFVSSQRDGAVYRVDLRHPGAAPKAIKTGAHPVCLLLDKAQDTLYVANAGADTVSVVNATTGAARSISVRPSTKLGALPGVSPTGLALSADEGTLYVSLGDLNAVAVIDLRAGKVRGYVPAGWYPTAVAAVGGGALLVANAKGVSALNPNPGHVKTSPASPNRYEDTFYDQSIIEGTVSDIPLAGRDLQADTRAVLADAGVGEGDVSPDPLPREVLARRGIKHVVYIIKENRTYDQVLGDVPQGNGDPSLAIFGQAVTPNLHALAERFVLLDNFYDCAEVSADGWPWSTQSIANEYVIRNVPYNYSGRGSQYNFEGVTDGFPTGGLPARDADGVPLSPLLFPQGAPVVPDVGAAPQGHLWDLAERAGLSLRNYGFFGIDGIKVTGDNNTEVSAPPGYLPDNTPAVPGLQPGGHYDGGRLDAKRNGRTDVDFRDFDLDYPDSDGPRGVGYKLTSYGRYKAPNRFQEWNREFQAMLQADPSGDSVPSLMLVRLMSDHTAGYKAGLATPAGHVADNDYGVAELVQALSRSPIWGSTAVFVVEDDAQDGPDHVDCHRSTAYVISPWITAHSVDHHFYNTDSLLHTMELVLGLPPLSQYDAIAPPINDFGTSPANSSVFTAEVPGVVSQTAARVLPPGSPLAKLARLTATMDFSREDLVPPALLNRVIWQSVRGVGSPVPAPRHGVIAAPVQVKGKAKADPDGD